MVDRASLESTIKSIIVPSTNMGYLGSLKNPKLLYILRHSSVTALFKTSAVTHKRFASISSLQIALFKPSTITHKGFASISSLQIALFKTSAVTLQRAVFESVYVSVLCVCVNTFLLPFFRSWLNACHPPSPLLFSVPLVSIRLTRLWTILCPVSMVLAQPALRAARKVMFITLHTVHISCAACAARAALICTTACCISLSPFAFAALPALLVRPAAVVLDGEQSRSGVEFQCIQLSHWVDGCFIFWRCRPHRIFMWETQTYCGLVGSGGADTHTDRVSHFSFFLPANSFCTFHFSFLLTLSALAFFLFYLLP